MRWCYVSSVSGCFSNMLQSYVSSVSKICSNCFHADVVKVDWDVAYVAMVVHLCCNRLSLMFHFFCTRMLQVFQTHVSSVSSIFFLYVASVASECFKSRSVCCTCCNDILTICPKYFICFRHMLQMFHLDIIKVDLVFECYSGTHLPQPLTCSCWAHVHACGSGGARAASTRNESGLDQDAAPRGRAHTWETERCAPHVKQTQACGRVGEQAQLPRAFGH
jgi:hypothetical protein